MGLFNVYTVANAYRSDYFQYLSEQWANDTDEFTGAWNRSSTSLITRVKTDTDMPKAQIALTANTAARLRTIFTFRCTPSKFADAASTTMVRGTFIEWEAKLSNVANADNSLFFMGVNASSSATRATNDLIAFGLSSDSLVAVSDSGGTETTTAISGITLADRNFYKIAITKGQIEYFINGNVVANHTTNIPDVVGYLQFNHDTEAGTSNLDVGFVHVFYRGIEDTRSF